MTIGAWLKATRLAQGRTLEEVCDQARLPHSTLCRIENDKRQPRFDTLQRLLRSLGKKIGDIPSPPPYVDKGFRA